MQKRLLVTLITLLLVLGNASFVTASGPAAKPQVRFSEWKEFTPSYSSKAFQREISVSDGGNYLMTYRVRNMKTNTYRNYYNAVYQGKGTQSVYTSDLNDVVIDNGKLFRYETPEERGLDIDQIITDHIRIHASDETSFIMVFCPRGGKRDGMIETVRVAFGECDLSHDSYEGVESIEILGVLRFPDEERRDLTFGSNVIQKDTTGYQVQMAFVSDYPDGIALIAYTNYSGTEVYVTQVIFDGVGVQSAYDPAKTPEDIKAGRFGIAGYTHQYVDAEFLN